MVHKREFEEQSDRLDKLEKSVNTIKSRLSVIEDRLMDIERKLRQAEENGKDVLDLSQVPIDHERK